mgnify:CR=1 FL=1
MTNRRGGPKVVHSPYNGLAAINDSSDAFQRKHALINPMQVDDISFPKRWKFRDVRSGIGDVYLEQSLSLKTKMEEYRESFPKEVQSMAFGRRQFRYVGIAGLAFAHQHAGFCTVAVQCFHQPMSGQCGSATLLCCTDDKYTHHDDMFLIDVAKIKKKNRTAYTRLVKLTEKELAEGAHAQKRVEKPFFLLLFAHLIVPLQA